MKFMNKLRRPESDPSSDPSSTRPSSWGKPYYNGTPRSIEFILQQYAEKRKDSRVLEKYSYLPRESLIALLFALGRMK